MIAIVAISTGIADRASHARGFTAGAPVQTAIKQGIELLESGLGAGDGAVESLISALHIAKIRAEPQGPGADADNASAQEICEDLARFSNLDLLSSDGDPLFVHRPVVFPGNPQMRGCLLARPSMRSPGALQLGFALHVTADPQPVVAGFHRTGVRYLLTLEVLSDGSAPRGRMRIVLPGAGEPAGEGIGDNSFRLGDEVAWDESATCGSWLVGRPSGARLVELADARANHRPEAAPSKKLLANLVVRLRALIS